MIQISNKHGFNLTLKGFLTAGLILALMIPAIFVMNLVEERKARQQEVIEEVSSKWAYRQNLTGPYLSVPYTQTLTDAAKNTTTVEKTLIILPEELNIDGKLEPQFKKRGIYKVALYRAGIRFNGNFILKNTPTSSNETIRWDEARLCLGVSDTRGIEAQPTGTFEGNQVRFEAGVPTKLLAASGASFPVNLANRPKDSLLSFNIPLEIRGSEHLMVVPTGKVTTTNLQSTWQSPSFQGKFLPDYKLDKAGFNASWKVLHFNRDFPQEWKNQTYPAEDYAFGVSLIQPTDNYAKTLRSVKYAIMFIGLTFGFFFLLEALQGHRVHPVQYLLTGLALIIFYTLLLSFSELIAFNYAYALATAATVGLITWYGRHLFKTWKNTLILGGFLGSLYAFMFVLIQLEDTSLLAGSIGLFVLIALAMHMSRKVNWYGTSPVDSNNSIQ